MKILQDFDCKFPHAKDKFITAFEETIVPRAVKLAAASRNDYIRSLSMLPSEGHSGEIIVEKMVILLIWVQIME